MGIYTVEGGRAEGGEAGYKDHSDCWIDLFRLQSKLFVNNLGRRHCRRQRRCRCRCRCRRRRRRCCRRRLRSFVKLLTDGVVDGRELRH